MRRIFVIEYDDELGPYWMNKDNLKSCLNSPAHCGPNIITDIDDVTEQFETVNEIVIRALDKIRNR